MSETNNSPGRATERLQAEVHRDLGLDTVETPGGASVPPVQPPETPQLPDLDLPETPAQPADTTPSVDLTKSVDTDRIPVEALPDKDLFLVAKQYNVTMDKDSTREGTIAALKAKGVESISAQQ